MRIQTFRAKSIQEALELVRLNLGPDASILDTREIRPRLFSRRMVEVEASREVTVSSHVLDQPPGPELQAGQTELTKQSSDTASQARPGATGSASSGLLNASERSLFPWRTSPAPPLSSELSGVAADLFHELASVGVDPFLARQLITEARGQCHPSFQEDGWLIRGRIQQLVSQRLPTTAWVAPEPGQSRLVALVGPTGVGKTTLLAKLAARARFEHGLEIGILSVDSWRGAAADQLLECAESVSAQLEIVSHAEQAVAAWQRLRECDLVLLDTAGRSPQDTERMQALSELMSLVQPDETHLVLAAHGTAAYAVSTLEAFSEVKITHLDLTKLDEASTYGQWLLPLWSSPTPLSLLTSGQEARGELFTVGPGRLASLLLGQDPPANAATPASVTAAKAAA